MMQSPTAQDPKHAGSEHAGSEHAGSEHAGSSHADPGQADTARQTSRAQRQIALCLSLLFAATGIAQAQQPAMGNVATRDARVTGGLEVHGDQAQLLTNAGVTAYDRTAPIALNRGGEVLVCSTSEFHLLRSGTGGALIFGLNRGALEIRSVSRPQDVVLTPDLKLTPITPGPLNLSLRVTPEGDTCIDNAGSQSPVLLVNDAFSSANYRVLPGQHLLFIKGDLHRVVDHERSPCGCPASVAPQVIAAEPGHPLTPSQAAAAHPFPSAQSAGLAPLTAPSNEAPVGTAGSQVTTSFSYAEGQAVPLPASGASSEPGKPSAANASAPGLSAPSPAEGTAPNPQSHGLGSSLRRFFHRLFHGSAN